MRTIIFFLAIAISIGCGKKASKTQPQDQLPTAKPSDAATPSAAASPTVATAQPTIKKTFTRREIELMFVGKNSGDIKKLLGPPDKSVKVPGPSRMVKFPTPHLQKTEIYEWHYSQLSVDAVGSGKTDSLCRLILDEYEPHGFIRAEFDP